MNTKVLMSSSAVVLGTIGVLLSFLPEEILAYASVSSPAFILVILQLLGAAYLGFALLNWMAKGSLNGSIYSRPVTIGNLIHFVVGGLALLRAAYASPDGTALWIAGAVYSIFGLLFFIVVFKHTPKVR